MNHIDQLAHQSKNPGEFAKGYFNYLKQVLDAIDTTSIDSLVAAFEESRLNGNTIFIVGNGGSATTATSMGNDIGFDILKKSGTDKPFRVLALTDNTSVITAIANDVGYENVFLNQLKIHYRQGDKLLAISASGNSPNVVVAAKWVKEQGGKVISFVGFIGGKLKELSDVVVHVQSEAGEYGPVEDAHLVLNHVLAHWFQFKLREGRIEGNIMATFDHIEVHVSEVKKYCDFLVALFEGGSYEVISPSGTSMIISPEGIHIEVKKKKIDQPPEMRGFCNPCPRRPDPKTLILNLGLKIESEQDASFGKVYFFKDHEGVAWHIKDLPE